MLILTRKPGESLYIGDVKVTIVEVKGNQIRVGIDAPPEIRIYREEIYVQILDENRKAAEAASVPGSGLEGLPGNWKAKEGSTDFTKKPGITGLRGFSSSAASQSLKKQSSEAEEDAPPDKPPAGPGSSRDAPVIFRKKRKKSDE